MSMYQKSKKCHAAAVIGGALVAMLIALIMRHIGQRMKKQKRMHTSSMQQA